METTFLYVLTDPTTGIIRYLGKSDDPFARFKRHLRDSSPSHKKNWIDSLKNDGLTPHMDLLDEVPVSQWQFWEREYIRVFRAIGIPLTNQCGGGDGLYNPSLETRAKLAANNKTRVWSTEARENSSKSHKESPASRAHIARLNASKLGVPQTLEHRDKKSQALKGRLFTEGHKANISKSLKGVPHTAARNENRSVGVKAYWTLRKLPLFSDGGGI